MVDNPKLRGMLELFHHAIREFQVRNRLCDAYKLHEENTRDLSRILCSYAKWQPGTVLSYRNTNNIVSLLRVDSIILREPEPLDMKPTYNYYVKPVIGYVPVLDNAYVIARLADWAQYPTEYKEATPEDTQEALRGMPRYTKSQVIYDPYLNVYEAKRDHEARIKKLKDEIACSMPKGVKPLK